MRETWNNLKRVYKYGRQFRKNLIIFTIMSIFFVAINIAWPIIGAKQLIYLTSNMYGQLLLVALIVLGLDFISSLFHWILRRNTQVFFRGTTKNIQLEVSNALLKIELSDIEKRSSGTFIQRIGNDTDEMSKIFTRGMGQLTSIVTNLGIFVAIFVINKVLFLYFFTASLLLLSLHLYKVKNVNERDKIYRKQREKTGGLISELVRGIRDIKMLNAKDSFMLEVEKNIDDLTDSQFKMRNTDMNYNSVIACTQGIINFLLVCLLVYLITHNYLLVAQALIVYNYRGNIFRSLIENIGAMMTEVTGFNLSCNRVFSILDDDEFTKEKFGNKHIDDIKGNFEFKDVEFSYNNDNKVLDKLSFNIKENETVAFVGKSGAGKTTIFSLLCKLYDIDKGNIYIDGIDINELDEYSIRNNITIISQNPYIFNMSIKDNLYLVKSDLTESEMKKACKLACLDEFIESLPDGYDTVVGEGGVTLSGGQRQRLAIARAFIQRTKIILFDEATSALDNETQASIQKAINNLKDDYTILIIAHRLSTIRNVDRILYLDNGTIEASGTHDELMNTCYKYKKLYESEIEKD